MQGDEQVLAAGHSHVVGESEITEALLDGYQAVDHRVAYEVETTVPQPLAKQVLTCLSAVEEQEFG